jgi:hypothetical protein
MNEKQWLTTTRPHLLLTHLGVAAGERKLRLLAVACCNRIRDRLTNPQWCSAVATAERFADGLCDDAELEAMRLTAISTAPFGNEGVAVVACCSSGQRFSAEQVLAPAGAAARRPMERKGQSDIVRDIFGNPFRPVAFAPAWRTDTAVTLARTMYESRDFGAMPILADALQDAGCDNPDILAHCRDTAQVHVRGCWVCDLVLGKE